MEFPLRSAQVQAALDAGKPLLSGKRSIACMGDLLTLASFSLVPVVSQSLVGAYTMQSKRRQSVSKRVQTFCSSPKTLSRAMD